MPDPTPRAGSFATTRWNVVVAAGHARPAERRAALEELARAYWFPLYAFARRGGLDPDTAADRTQGFFARLLERDDVARADPTRGRFRAFLATAFRHFLANERDRERAEKRGGARSAISIDARLAEQRWRDEPLDRATPESAFERAWVAELVAHALARLRDEQVRIGRDPLFDRLRPALAAEDDAPKLAAVARDLAMTENAVKVALHRLRKRFGELLRDEVAGTLDDPRDVEDEIAELFRACEP